jgi:hypothetical protein
MKTKTIYLTTTLLLTSAPMAFSDSATTHLHLRYGDNSGQVRLSVDHDIKAGQRDMPADRKFSMSFEISEASGFTSVKINKVKASYTAHAMTQRLPTSSLAGQGFTLSKVNNGRAWQHTDPDEDPEIPVGQIIGADYPIGLALVDVLPILPEEAVSMGSTWVTTRDTRSLEGWAWASGQLKTEHAVTAVDQKNGHTIVSVTSQAQSRLGKIEGVLEYTGEGKLERTSDWKFDVNDGRLLSISMVQRTSGLNILPQGAVDVRQNTRVNFSTEMPGQNQVPE